jgi:hypothetical protein
MAFAVGLAFAGLALSLYWQLRYETLCAAWDAWFDADVQRVTLAISSRGAITHFRSNVHPLWSLLVVTPFFGIAKLVSLPLAIQAYVGATAAGFGALLYTAARTLRIGRIDAALVCGLFLSTACAIFWLPIPESHVAGGATLLIALIWLGQPHFHNAPGAVAQQTTDIGKCRPRLGRRSMPRSWVPGKQGCAHQAGCGKKATRNQKENPESTSGLPLLPEIA